MPDSKAFQDFYPDHLAYCYGCGRLNEHGLQIKSYWDEANPDQTVAVLHPRAEHIAIPGFVYGGFIASVIDCHGTGSAAAFAHRAEGRPIDSEPPLRFLTASLQVDFLKPTPLGIPLILYGRARELKGRKVIVEIDLVANGEPTARGQVVAVQVPTHLMTGT